MSSDTLRARSLVSSQRAFDWEPPRRRAHLQRGSIEPLKAQQLPGAVGGAPRGPKNERPLGNSRPVPSLQAGKEQCSSSVTQCLKGILSQPRPLMCITKGPRARAAGPTVPAGRPCDQVWQVHPEVERGPGARPRPGLSLCFARSHTAGSACQEADGLGLRPSLGKWRRRRSTVAERPLGPRLPQRQPLQE